jgi:hypothetical protein
MNNGTNIRQLFGIRLGSCSDVFSFAPECMPDKIAGQAQFSTSFVEPFFIGKMGS